MEFFLRTERERRVRWVKKRGKRGILFFFFGLCSCTFDDACLGGLRGLLGPHGACKAEILCPLFLFLLFWMVGWLEGEEGLPAG